MTKTESTCENCGHDSLESFIDRPGHQLKRCPRCNLFQKGVLPSNDVYEGDYHDCYSSRKRSKEITAAIRLASITKELKTDAVRVPHLLDIGCSVGATVKAAEDLGWNATGVDVSQGAIDFCRTQGLNCFKIDGTALPFGDNFFDVVANWHVIEHVSDVRETLAEWLRVLKPGGLMILETPDSTCWKAKQLGAEYKKFWPPEHLYTFDPANLSSILRSSGFEILPSRLIGKSNVLPAHLNLYAIGYRGLRAAYRKLGLCKSLELCCRKPVESYPKKAQRAVA
jgi:SAM-dependent methyltransferase